MSVPPGFLESLHDSPAIAYVKALDGRYQYVNRRYCEFFGVDESDIRGRNDGELGRGATIDGPRTASGIGSEGEPLELEYTVGPVDGRPALAVWRFAVRGPDGDAVAVCAVAAPVAEAAVARLECERLVSAGDSAPGVEAPTQEDRIAALHEASARAARRAHELVSELTNERERRVLAEERARAAAERVSELETALASAEGQPAPDHELAQMLAEAERRTEAVEAAAQELGDQLAAERARSAEMHASLEAVRAELAAERIRADEAEGEAQSRDIELADKVAEANQRAASAEARIGELEEQLTGARADREALLAEWTALDASHTDTPATAAPDPAPASSDLRWDTAAGRALTLALAQTEDWREGVKAAIGVLGAEGGWDAICAWQPDDRQEFAACFAMWTGGRHGLSAFETATWQRRQPLGGSTIGQAFSWADSRWLTAEPDAPEHRLKLLAQHGMRGALIVAVRDGARTIAALELLTSSPAPPSIELTEAIDAIALQLGHFGHLVSSAAQPRWRVGRV